MSWRSETDQVGSQRISPEFEPVVEATVGCTVKKVLQMQHYSISLGKVNLRPKWCQKHPRRNVPEPPSAIPSSSKACPMMRAACQTFRNSEARISFKMSGEEVRFPRKKVDLKREPSCFLGDMFVGSNGLSHFC